MSESAAQRPQSTARAGFGYGLSLARDAARALLARPGLLVAVLALASAAHLSAIAADQVYWRYCSSITRAQHSRAMAAIFGQQEPDSSEREKRAPPNLTTRWLSAYGAHWPSAAALSPLSAFSAPLATPSAIADPWGSCLAQLMPSITAFHRNTATLALWFELRGILRRLPQFLVGTLLVVGLLGWVRDARRPLRVGDWIAYWRAHYVSVLSIVLLVALCASVISFAVGWIGLAKGLEWHLWSPKRIEPRGMVLTTLHQVVVVMLLLAVMLAPFVAVARGLGPWSAIVAGLRLMRHHSLSLLALFIVFRVGWEVLAPWSAFAPQSAGNGGWIGALSAPEAWRHWAGLVGLALLGLWAAYAFMEMAREPKAPAAAVS